MKKRTLAAATALVTASVITLLAALGALRAPDRYISDALYQRNDAPEGNIVIIGADRSALDAYGPFQSWSRSGIAEVIDILNVSEDCRPAVIGLDVLFSGESGSGETDASLAAAAEKHGNVIAACFGSFDADFVETGGVFEADSFLLTAFDGPYPALNAAASSAHINAMLDSDGVLRHHLLYFDRPDGARVKSLALAMAEKYAGRIALPRTDSRGFWYLPFCGAPGDFEMISVREVIAGDYPPEYFKNKLVLIGPYAEGLQDSYITSADRTRHMYGVEYQANAVHALLSGDFKREVPDGIQLALLFAAVLLAFALFRRRRVLFSTSAWLAVCAGWTALCFGLYDAGLVLRPLWIPAGVTVVYAGCLAVNYMEAAFERRQVTATLQRYVAPEIVSQLLDAGPDALRLGGNKRDIAVLFVDIRGFTAMSELLDPEQVVEILNQYLTLTTKCVMDNHGTLDKFVGDCTMAFWNAPLNQEDYVMLACRAAMDMLDGAKPLAETLLRKYGREISFGIGIHAGPAVIGNIGAPVRMDYTAIGDTVNTASRLEANAPGSRIYISREVADRLKGRIAATPLENAPRLKGKSEGFEILTLDAIL